MGVSVFKNARCRAFRERRAKRLWRVAFGSEIEQLIYPLSDYSVALAGCVFQAIWFHDGNVATNILNESALPQFTGFEADLVSVTAEHVCRVFLSNLEAVRTSRISALQ